MKNTYYWVTRKATFDGKNYYINQVMKCSSGTNLKNIIERYHNIISVTPCETKKEAEHICDVNNKGHFDNGNYLYQHENDSKIYPAKNFYIS